MSSIPLLAPLDPGLPLTRKPLGTIFCQERLPSVWLLVVVVVKYGDVVMRVAEKMLLVCVQYVIDGWIWICQMFE